MWHVYILFNVDVHIYLYRIFWQNELFQFVEIKCVEHDLTWQTVNREFEKSMSSFGKLITNICFHHVYNVNYEEP